MVDIMKFWQIFAAMGGVVFASIAGIIWFVRLEGKVAMTKEKTDRLENQIAQQQASLAELNSTLVNLDKTLALVAQTLEHNRGHVDSLIEDFRGHTEATRNSTKRLGERMGGIEEALKAVKGES